MLLRGTTIWQVALGLLYNSSFQIVTTKDNVCPILDRRVTRQSSPLSIVILHKPESIQLSLLYSAVTFSPLNSIAALPNYMYRIGLLLAIISAWWMVTEDARVNDRLVHRCYLTWLNPCPWVNEEKFEDLKHGSWTYHSCTCSNCNTHKYNYSVNYELLERNRG